MPIGVFDSGVGGLTVLAALRARLPAENFLYLGDTARLPYGTKTAGTVERYALQAVACLVGRGVKAVVIACNTASAAALPALAAKHQVPLLGVVEPGAEAAVRSTRNDRIAVLATESTVRAGAYQRAIAALRPDARVTAVAASLFVALAEEGWVEGAIAESIAARYLAPLFNGMEAPDTLVLGCTHFPPLLGAIRSVVGTQVQIVDSAATTAQRLEALIAPLGLLRSGNQVRGETRFLVTDGIERFCGLGRGFSAARLSRGTSNCDLQARAA